MSKVFSFSVYVLSVELISMEECYMEPHGENDLKVHLGKSPACRQSHVIGTSTSNLPSSLLVQILVQMHSKLEEA